MTLDPISPDEAVEMYIEDKQRESAAATVHSHRSRLGHFLEWCNEEGIENMNNLTARRAHECRLWRRSAGDRDPNTVTMKGFQDTTRVFLKWAVTIDAVPDSLPAKILSPELGKHENERDDMLDPDVGDEVLTYLEKFGLVETSISDRFQRSC